MNTLSLEKITNTKYAVILDFKFRVRARFSKAPETFRARKENFSSSVYNNGEVYTPETSCLKGTSVYVKNT